MAKLLMGSHIVSADTFISSARSHSLLLLRKWTRIREIQEARE